MKISGFLWNMKIKVKNIRKNPITWHFSYFVMSKITEKWEGKVK